MQNKNNQKNIEALENQSTLLLDLMVKMSKRGDDFTHVAESWKMVTDALNELKNGRTKHLWESK